MSEAAPVLVIAVAYKTPALVDDLVTSFTQDPVTGSSEETSPVHLVIVDNSPNPSGWLSRAPQGPIRYLHFAHNPGFVGGAREALTAVRENAGNRELSYTAVVLCNVDLTFDCGELLSVVEQAREHTGDTRWILAPDIVEAGRSYRTNPHILERSGGFNRRRRDQVRQRFLIADIAFRQLYWLRRRYQQNPHADLPAFTKMYAAYGAYTVFGSGYFAAGGVFHEGPLFGEEYGFGEQAHVLGVPVLWMPQMVVRHEGEASVSASLNGYRQRHRWYVAADAFYQSWDASSIVGEMSGWFVEPDTSEGLCP